MGRKKIDIKPIKDERNKHVTFNKRKAGLVKKAIELSILCGCEIALVVFNSEGQLFEYCSQDPRYTLQRYCQMAHLPHDRLTNEDYARFQKKGKKAKGDYSNLTTTQLLPGREGEEGGINLGALMGQPSAKGDVGSSSSGSSSNNSASSLMDSPLPTNANEGNRDQLRSIKMETQSPVDSKGKKGKTTTATKRKRKGKSVKSPTANNITEVFLPTPQVESSQSIMLNNLIRQHQTQQKEQQELQRKNQQQQQNKEKEFQNQFSYIYSTPTSELSSDLSLTPTSLSHVNGVMTNAQFPSPLIRKGSFASDGGKELTIEETTPSTLFSNREINFGLITNNGSPSISPSNISPTSGIPLKKRKNFESGSTLLTNEELPRPKKKKKNNLTIDLPQQNDIPLEPLSKK